MFVQLSTFFQRFGHQKNMGLSRKAFLGGANTPCRQHFFADGTPSNISAIFMLTATKMLYIPFKLLRTDENCM